MVKQYKIDIKYCEDPIMKMRYERVMERSKKKLAAYLHNEGCEVGLKGNEGGIFRAIGDHKIIIWGENEASVVHEMVHAVRYVMLSRGMGKMDENNDEIYAYTMGWLYKELVRNGE